MSATHYVITAEQYRRYVSLAAEWPEIEGQPVAIPVENVTIWEVSRAGEYEGWEARPTTKGRSDMWRNVR